MQPMRSDKAHDHGAFGGSVGTALALHIQITGRYHPAARVGTQGRWASSPPARCAACGALVPFASGQKKRGSWGSRAISHDVWRRSPGLCGPSAHWKRLVRAKVPPNCQIKTARHRGEQRAKVVDERSGGYRRSDVSASWLPGYRKERAAQRRPCQIWPIRSPRRFISLVRWPERRMVQCQSTWPALRSPYSPRRRRVEPDTAGRIIHLGAISAPVAPGRCPAL
jgi:hypothetical protein